MARFDPVGMFWEDIVEDRVVKEKIKREPPDPVWLKDDYLPSLAEARAFEMPHMSDQELMIAHAEKHPFVWDIESYPNYWLCGFMSTVTQKVVKFAFQRGQHLPPSRMFKLRWMLEHLLLVGFNDSNYDLPIAAIALTGATTDDLADATDLIINGGDYGNGMRPQDVLKKYKATRLKVNHIDLIELTPLSPGLKVIAGRIHAPRMQDLPFQPGKDLTPDQITIINWYWVNDLHNTRLNYAKHKTAIELRERLTAEYGVDVRSKSDPQVAESLIRAEITRLTGQKWFPRAEIIPGRVFQYTPPAYVAYQTPTMQWVLDFIKRQKFVIGDQGEPLQSPDLEQLRVPIGNAVYSMGIGGLHSTEERQIHIAGDEYEISDNDVTSYYPSMMIKQGMYPPQIGPIFIQVFERFYDRRIDAKQRSQLLLKSTVSADILIGKELAKDAETLKIVLNGTFGKTGERGGRAIMYYPEMMIQTTIGGQLSLFMLIEWFEMNGITVISANTDGVTVKCPKDKVALKNDIIKHWEKVTGLGMESVFYKAIYSRDVNNYIAVYDKPASVEKDPSVYRYAKAIGAYRKTTDAYPMKWNPVTDVCKEALIEYLATGRSIEDHIRACTDFRKFVQMRAVRGGAVKDGEYLGKVVRWYYAQGEEGEIITAKAGHVVPTTKGAKPCMTMPESFPVDVDFDFYIARAHDMLEGFSPKVAKVKKAA